mmetsp:Transcript_16413/g.37989  ORF Transcript_16413/g.37989 Transcript_16413/m.37989 type:complete len:261 (+) Transcript_16413:181-963(+)
MLSARFLFLFQQAEFRDRSLIAQVMRANEAKNIRAILKSRENISFSVAMRSNFAKQFFTATLETARTCFRDGNRSSQFPLRFELRREEPATAACAGSASRFVFVLALFVAVFLHAEVGGEVLESFLDILLLVLEPARHICLGAVETATLPGDLEFSLPRLHLVFDIVDLIRYEAGDFARNGGDVFLDPVAAAVAAAAVGCHVRPLLFCCVGRCRWLVLFFVLRFSFSLGCALILRLVATMLSASGFGNGDGDRNGCEHNR